MLHRLVSLVPIYLLFSQALFVHAHPIGSRKKGFKNLNVNVTTLRTVHTTMTGDGPVTETCDITLTPITDASGKPAVEEVRKCFLTFEDEDGDDGSIVTTVPSVSGTITSQIPPIPVTSSSTESPTSTGSSTPTENPTPIGTPTPTPVTSDKGSVSTPAPTPTSSPQPTESTPSSTGNATPIESSSTPVTSAISTGVVVPSNDPNTSAPSPTPSPTPTPAPAPPVESSAAATPTTTGDASGTTAAQSSGTSAADSTPSSTAAFQLPGKKLSVLPIGLGVFAGISVIALIVVGLVTYERTKYRKAFRQRKLAESGATMGYGGMAQRP